MKTIYILLTRSGTLLSKLVYAATGASYTHASMAFDAELSCLYSSTRKNGYTMFPAGPSKEYLNRGVFRLRDNAPCALYALEVSDEAYSHALLPQLKCLYKGRLADLPQRKAMDLGETPSMVSIYTGLLVKLLQHRAQSLFE